MSFRRRYVIHGAPVGIYQGGGHSITRRAIRWQPASSWLLRRGKRRPLAIYRRDNVLFKRGEDTRPLLPYERRCRRQRGTCGECMQPMAVCNRDWGP